MSQIIKLRNKIIGKGKKTFIIAEIGINHRGNFQKCKILIKEASKCGADAAKIQLVNVEESYNEDTIISRSMSGEASTVEINDLSWRYPLI